MYIPYLKRFLIVFFALTSCVTGEIHEVYPTQNYSCASDTTIIKVVFSEDILDSSISDSSFLVYGSQSGLNISKSLSYDSTLRTITFHPQKPFLTGEIIKVTLLDRILNFNKEKIESFSWNFRIASNSGNAKFQLSNIKLSGAAEEIRSVDYNNDSYLDILTSSIYYEQTSERKSYVFFNNGNADFIDSLKIDEINSRFFAHSNFNNDGFLDLAVAVRGVNQLRIFFGNNDGSFGDRIIVSLEEMPLAIESGDFNNDGLDDIAVITSHGSTDDSLRIILNQGSSQFIITQTVFSGNTSVKLKVGDYDNDGDSDLFVLHYGSHEFSVFRNDSNGFVEVINKDTNGSEPTNMSVADFNNDGLLDLAIINKNNVSTFLNDGQNNYVLNDERVITDYLEPVTDGDFNNDGYIDVATCRYGGAVIYLLLNNGEGKFEDTEYINITEDIGVIGVIASGDYDDDGSIDISAGLLKGVGGNIYILLNNELTSFETPNFIIKPIVFNLFQNYPNPFNPSTKIKFALPKPENVKIEVYNILSRKVETLLNEHMSAGFHEFQFNGSHLSSGIYFYRIKAGDFQDVKRMILLK